MRMKIEEKAIIDGKLYDTAQAEQIGKWSNGFDRSNFEHTLEVLYKTDSGQHFLFGTGGAKTRYAARHGDSWSTGTEICPLSEEEAYQWAEGHLDADTVLEAFPDHVDAA